MGQKDENESPFPSLTFPSTTMDSPDHPSGATTPPLQTPASIPFKWEVQPGKPRPCPTTTTTTTTRPVPARSLDLPPCRKTPSPTAVLDGPYNVGRPRFSSFRLIFRDQAHHDSSFDSFSWGSSSTTPEGTDALLGGKKGGLFGKFKKGMVDGGSCRFSPSTSVSSCESHEESRCGKNDGGVKVGSKSSFYSAPPQEAAKPHLWTSIYKGIKHAVRWKSSRKSNKVGREY